MRGSITVLPVVLLALACSDTSGPVAVLEPGVWGGERANLIVTFDSARAEFDCASGWLDGPIALDAAGQFAVDGRFRFEAGPVFAPVPAQWSGTVAVVRGGSQVTLSVLVLDPRAEPLKLGPWHLESGVRLTLGMCA
jgi:hypothetical protein